MKVYNLFIFENINIEIYEFGEIICKGKSDEIWKWLDDKIKDRDIVKIYIKRKNVVQCII